MKARNTLHFRERQRFDLLQLARASRTLRKYVFCEADVWTSNEREDAALLLQGLDNIRVQQKEALRKSGRPLDRDAWLWPGGSPDYVAELAGVVRHHAGTDAHRLASLEAVAERLLDVTRVRQPTAGEKDAGDLLAAAVSGCDYWQDDASGMSAALEREVLALSAGGDEDSVNMYRRVARSILSRCRCVGAWDSFILDTVPSTLQPLHLPAVKEALGSLIPEKLHPSLDNAAKRMKYQSSEMRGAVHMQCDAWRVSVFEEETLNQGSLRWDVMEFSRRSFAVFVRACHCRCHSVVLILGKNLAWQKARLR